MRATEIKRNFGKRYVKPFMTPFKAWWGGGTGTYDMPKSHVAEDAWNACLYTARERLRMHGFNDAADILDILEEEQ